MKGNVPKPDFKKYPLGRFLDNAMKAIDAEMTKPSFIMPGQPNAKPKPALSMGPDDLKLCLLCAGKYHDIMQALLIGDQKRLEDILTRTADDAVNIFEFEGLEVIPDPSAEKPVSLN